MGRYSCLFLLFGFTISCQNFNRSDYPITPKSDITIKEPMPSSMHHHAKPEFDYYIINNTPYYQNGPQQAQPADGIFPVGTKVKLFKTAGSYAFVLSEEGIKAYVFVDDIKEIGSP